MVPKREAFTHPSHLNWRIGDLVISIPQFASLIASLGIVVGLSFMLKKTRIGRALWSTAESPDTATLMGSK